MDTNFDKNIGHVNNIDFKGSKKPEKKAAPKNEHKQMKEIPSDKGASRAYFMGGISFKGSVKESFKIPELTDEEFEAKKKKIQDGVDKLPEEMKNKFDGINFNKYSIFVAEKFLDNPQLLDMFDTARSFRFIFTRIGSPEQAEAKCQIIDKILSYPQLIENQSVQKCFKGIIVGTNSKETFDAKCKIMEGILSRPELFENEYTQKSLGGIIEFTSSEKDAEWKLQVMDKIFQHRELFENKSIQKNLGDIITSIGSEETYDIKSKIIDKILNNPEWLKNESVKDNLADIIMVAYSKEEADATYKLLDKILGSELLKDQNISSIIQNIAVSTEKVENADAKSAIIDKITEYKELKDNRNMKAFMTEIVSTTSSPNTLQSRCSIIDKIMNNETLTNNKKVMDTIGSIIYHTSGEKDLEAKFMIIDKFMEYEELKNNESMAQALGNLISSSTLPLLSDARCQIIDKIMRNKSLRTNKGIMDNLGKIITLASKPKEAQAKLEAIGEIQLMCGMLGEEKEEYKLEELKQGMGEIMLYFNNSPTQMQELRDMVYDKDFPNTLIGATLYCGLNTHRDYREKIIEVYKNNEEKIRELQNNGYMATIEKLQNSDEINIVFNKMETDNNNDEGKPSRTRNTIRFDKDGVVLKSKCKIYNLGNHKMLERTTTADGKYTCDSYYELNKNQRKILKKEIRVVNGKNGPLYVQKTTASDLMEGAFDTTVYNLAQTDKNINEVLEAIKKEKLDKSSDILEKIEASGIKGWNFAKTIENHDGTKTHIEKFQRGDLHTQRKYTSNDEGTKTSLDYTISDTKGKKILNVHRTFELDGNKSIATLNRKEYIAEFDDEEMTVKIGDQKIDFKSKMQSEKPENQKVLWGLIKKTPGDLILNFSDIEHLEYEEDNGHWMCEKNKIGTEDSLATISHELGHYLDSTEARAHLVAEIQQKLEDKGEKEDGIISKNPELVKIYTEEIEDFKKNISEAEQENIKYFSQIGGSGGGTGLSELVAEVNMLCTTQINLDLQTRSMYLTRYFPKTTAAAAKLLGYSMT